VWIERQVGAHLAVRYQRQNDKRCRSKDQRIVQFVFRDDTGDKVVQPRLRVEKHRHCHGDCGGSLGRLHAHATQQGRQDQNDFRGQTRILILGAPIGYGDHDRNTAGQDCKQPYAPEGECDSP
jgi:hypothetical protein